MEDYPKIYLYQRIVHSKLFIDRNYAESIDINNIADEACFSKFHFIRLFKKIYGRTPHQYLIRVRMEKALQLLKSGRTVSEACFEVGFESVSTFSGLFKKIYGTEPSLYGKRQKQQRAQLASEPLKFVPHCFAYNYGWELKSNFEEILV